MVSLYDLFHLVGSDRVDLLRTHSLPAPVERWLPDPGLVQPEIPAHLTERARDAWAASRSLVLATVLTTALLILTMWLLRARAGRRARAAARWVAVIAPTATETADGAVMWRQLSGLLGPGAPRARGRLLAWELHAAHEQVHAGLWVPAGINPAHVAAAVTGAYPQGQATYARAGKDLGPPLPQPWPAPPTFWWRLRRYLGERRGRAAPERRPASVGYLLVPRTSMWHPLLAGSTSAGGRTGPRTGTLRARSSAGGDGLGFLCAGLADVPAGYRAIVQILARPLPAATRRAARQVRRSGGSPPGPGLLAQLVLGVLGTVESVLREMASFLGSSSPPPRTAASTTVRTSVRSPEPDDPITRQQRREAGVKASAELVEICVRVCVSGPHRRHCRERAWQLANALRAVITAQGTSTLRLPRAEETVTARATSNGRAVGLRRSSRAGHRRGWFVATDTEVGALARLPHHPALYRLEVGRAPHLPAPPAIPRMRLAQDEPPSIPRPGPGPAALAHEDSDQPAEPDPDPESGDESSDEDDDGSEDWDGWDEDWDGWDEDFPELGGDGAGPQERWSFEQAKPERRYRKETRHGGGARAIWISAAAAGGG
jgi:hypothetical protein